MSIAGLVFTVNQSGAPCSYSIAPTQSSWTAAGGSGHVNVTAGAGCSWTAVSHASWVTVTGGTSGIGNGTVSYSVAPYTGKPRTRNTTITIAGMTFSVNQSRK